MRHYNLNGSSPYSILSDARATLESLRILQTCIADLIPHGRDYQGAPDGLFESDRADFRAAIAALAEVYEYVQGVAFHAADAWDKVKP